MLKHFQSRLSFFQLLKATAMQTIKNQYYEFDKSLHSPAHSKNIPHKIIKNVVPSVSEVTKLTIPPRCCSPRIFML